MKLEQGVVIKVEGEFAYLIPSPSQGCEHCVLKDLCIGNTGGKLRAHNLPGAREGDLVEFQINIARLNVNLILLSAAGLVLLLAGALFGYYVNPLGLNPSLSGGLFALGFSLLVLPLARSRRFSSEELYPEIKRVVRRKS